MTLNLSQIIYQPLGLKEIRLMTFEKDSNPPAFSLRHCKMRHALRRYICLSYCWGDTLNSHLVLSNKKELRVHANLYDALVQLARREDTLDYWIDAICINQSDLEEKGSQIQLMGQIFERAAWVFVWLGTPSVMEDRDFESLPDLEVFSQSMAEAKARGSILEMQDLVRSELPSLDSSFWGTLANLFTRPWFKRLWIVQEVTLCRSSSFMLAGNRTLSFRWVFHAAQVFLQLSFLGLMPSKLETSQAGAINLRQVAMFLSDINVIRYYILEKGIAASLSAQTHLLLRILLRQKVTNAADRVHGMLGMFNHKFVKNVATHANSTVAETYQSFAVASLLADRRLSLLHFVSPTPAVIGLPSWCPDLSRLSAHLNFASTVATIPRFRSGIQKSRYKRITNLHTRLSRSILPRMKSQWPQTTIQFVPASKELLVKGILIDKIAHVVSDDPSWGGEGLLPAFAEVENWEQECLKISQTTLECRETIPVSHVRTLIANTRLNDHLQREDPSAAYLSVRKALETRDHQTLGVDSLDPGFLYFWRMALFCRFRRFISTTGSRIGLCPPHSKQGDLICILWGARSPFVLRPVPNMENFQMIGECYIDGLMYGEAFQIKAKERLKDMVFPLI